MRLSVLDQNAEKVDVLYQISATYSDNDCFKAFEYAHLSLSLAQTIDYDHGKMIAYDMIGDLQIDCNANAIEALEYYNDAMKVALTLNDSLEEALILNAMSYAYLELAEYDKAIKYYNNLKARAKDLGTQYLVNEANGSLGDVYLIQGDTARALQYYEEVLTIESQNNFEETDPYDLYFISHYFFIKKDLVNAEKFGRMTLNKFEGSGSSGWLSASRRYYGQIKQEMGERDEAINYFYQALSVSEEKGLVQENVENYEALSNIYRENGDYKKAHAFLEKYSRLKDSLDMAVRLSRTDFYETEFDNILKERENERTENELRSRELEAENTRIINRFGIALLILVIAFLFLLYRRLRKGNRLNKQLQQQQEQLQKLSIVAANIEQMVMIVGSDDRIEWVNAAFEKKFGFLKFEAINRTPYELLGGEYTDLEEVKEINRRIFYEKIAFDTNLVQFSKGGKAYLTRLHVSPILDENRNLERYIVISHDITEQQKVAEELKELSLVASKTNNSIIIFNDEMRVIWVNDSFTEISGMSAEAAIGKGPLDVYNGPLLIEEEKIALMNRYNSQKPFVIEFESTNRLSDKSYWISMSVTPVFDDNEKLIKYINVATDITQLKQLEEQYAGLVEGSTDMIYEIETNGNFLFVNDVMSNLLGWTKKKLLETNFLEFIPESDKQRVFEFYAKQVRDKESTSYIEFPALTKDGKMLWLGQRARAKLDDKGDKVIGFNVISRDITDQKAVEDALKKTYENTSLLSEIGMQITSTHSVIEIIDKVYGNINKLMDANVFGIAIPNKDKTRLIFPEVIENGVPLKDYGFELSDNTRLGVICYNQAREIIIDDYVNQFKQYVPVGHIVGPIAGDQTISLIYLPLMLKGKTIGVITVQSFQPNAYDEYQVNLVRSMASFVAIAMENAALYETMEDEITRRTREVREQKEELEVNYNNTRLLSEIGQLISSTLDLNEIFEELYDRVGQLMDAEIFAIRIYNEETETLHFDYTMEKGKRCEPFAISIKESDNYNVWCIENRKEIFLNDNKNEYHKYVNEIQVLQGEMPNSLLFYPMEVENKMVGVITIQSFKKNAYQSYHLDILKTIASYIGTVIDNATLYSTLETKVQERTEELAKKNSDITASINYAKRLQKGILPTKNFIRQLLPESFVYFKPKDIVSGDFYWVDRTRSKILFAVVDCTGHGVPGAMMSIIGRNLLDQAVNEKGITLPSQILNFLQVGLSLAFGQTGDRKADLFDGMDLSLCSLDLKNNILEFAGANNSLYLIQDDELIVLKGDKVGISAEYEISNSYTNLEIEIKKGDVIYLTSDGYPDQFGGERYKKFTYGRMQNLFEEIYKKDMSTQYDIIKARIMEWKGEREQTDDICIMGVRI